MQHRGFLFTSKVFIFEIVYSKMSLRSQVQFESQAFSHHHNPRVTQQRSQLEEQVERTLVEMWTSTKTPPAAGHCSHLMPRLMGRSIERGVVGGRAS